MPGQFSAPPHDLAKTACPWGGKSRGRVGGFGVTVRFSSNSIAIDFALVRL